MSASDNKLYTWQQQCIQTFLECGCRGIVRAVTGTGKTRLAIALIMEMLQKYPDLQIKIVVPTLPLAAQWGRSLRKVAEQLGEPGYWHGESKSRAKKRVMIYVINSARYSISRHILDDQQHGRPVFLICDECHHYASAENRRIFGFQSHDEYISEKCFILGLSATPEAGDYAYLQTVIGNAIYDYSFSDAHRDQTVSDCCICKTAVSFTGPELVEYAGLTEQLGILYQKLLKLYPFLKRVPSEQAYHALRRLAEEAGDDPEEPAVRYRQLLLLRKQIVIMAENRIACGLQLIRSLSPKDRIIVFCERIEQADLFYQKIRNIYPGRCAVYHSQMTKNARQIALMEFHQGHVRILISCKALDEGIDVPDANVGIVLSSTTMQKQRIQRLGRIIRRSASKETACLYYLHVRESAEDPFYLDDEQNFRYFRLRYYAPEHGFSNEAYEAAALRLLKEKEALLSKEQIAELKSCIAEGLTRADYLLPGRAVQNHIRQAADRHEKNYWITMLAMQKV